MNNRWLGGMLTNWGSNFKSIKKLNNIDNFSEDEEQIDDFTKKEIMDLTCKRTKLLKSLAGIRNIDVCPDLIIVIDTNREHLAISEAVKLNVPIVAVVDSNSDPNNVDYPIPGNDDAIRSIRLYCHLFAEAVLAGIQDALTDSGADAGLAKKVEDKTLEGVTKIVKVAKVSKARPAAPTKKVEAKSAAKAADKVKAPAKKVEEKK